MENLELKIGDVVYLNSEKSVKMTVTATDTKFGIELHYFNEVKREFIKVYLPIGSLTLSD